MGDDMWMTGAEPPRGRAAKGGIGRYVLGCLRAPRALVAVGSGELNDKHLDRQLAVSFAAANLLVSGFLGYLRTGWGTPVLTDALMGVLSAAAGLLAVTFAFCVLTSVSVPKARFTPLLRGLAFVQMLTAVALALLGLGAGLCLLAGAPPEAAAKALGYAFYVVMVLYTGIFSFGVFEGGRLNAYVLAVVAGFVSTGLQHVIAVGLGGIAAG
jgi:hypothetical protein